MAEEEDFFFFLDREEDKQLGGTILGQSLDGPDEPISRVELFDLSVLTPLFLSGGGRLSAGWPGSLARIKIAFSSQAPD